MKRVLLLTFIFCIVNAFGQKINRPESKRILFRTNQVLQAAKKSIETNRKYSGYFAKAYAHQKLAITFFRRDRFEKAIYQSLKARYDALKSIRDNLGITPKEMKLDAIENGFHSRSPLSSILEQELEEENVPLLKDEDLVSKKLMLSIE